MTCIFFQDNHKVKDVLASTKGNMRKRQGLIYELCKNKSVCEGGDELDLGPDMRDPENPDENPEEGGEPKKKVRFWALEVELSKDVRCVF